MKRLKHSKGFSLVEVVLALGIASFALIAMLGLLSVGFTSLKGANDEAGAANVLNIIGENLRSATSTDSVTFNSNLSSQTISYSIGSTTPATVNWTNLSSNATLQTSETLKRYSAVLYITSPPGSLASPGRAVISVCWPAQAHPTWNAATQSWTGATGFISTGIQFLPRQ